MEEILYQLRLVVYPIIYKALYTSQVMQNSCKIVPDLSTNLHVSTCQSTEKSDNQKR